MKFIPKYLLFFFFFFFVFDVERNCFVSLLRNERAGKNEKYSRDCEKYAPELDLSVNKEDNIEEQLTASGFLYAKKSVIQFPSGMKITECFKLSFSFP